MGSQDTDLPPFLLKCRFVVFLPPLSAIGEAQLRTCTSCLP